MANGREVAEFLGKTCEVRVLQGDLDSLDVVPAVVEGATMGTISYLKSGRSLAGAPSILIADATSALDERSLLEAGVAVLAMSHNPRLDFARVSQRFFVQHAAPGIDASARISPDAVIDPGASVGPGCVIGHAVVGSGCVLAPNVTLYDGVVLGERVVVHAGTVIGSDGFGYERDEENRPVKLPHLGGVVIENDVEIGSNTSVDRGTIGETRICARAKIDNLCHIAHNVRIGEDTLIAANALVAGSSTVGDRVWIGPSATISNGLRVGDDAFVSLGAVVTRDVDDGAKVTGNFAVGHEAFLRHLRGMR